MEDSKTMTELQERLTFIEEQLNVSEKQMLAMKAQLEASLHNQIRLEEMLETRNMEIEKITKERQEAYKVHRDLEKKIQREKVQIFKEKKEWQKREEELHQSIKVLKEKLQKYHQNLSKMDVNNNKKQSKSLHANDETNVESIIQRKDVTIESMKIEINKLRVQLKDLECQNKQYLEEIQHQIIEFQKLDAKLVECNENYQLLLSEKMQYEFNQLNLKNTLSSLNDTPVKNYNLALELSSSKCNETCSNTNELDKFIESLKNEIRTLKETNDAMALYISSIIKKLLDNEGYEQILSKDELQLYSSTEGKETKT